MSLFEPQAKQAWDCLFFEAYEHAKFEYTYRGGICCKELTPAEIRKAIEHAAAAAGGER